MELDLQVAKSFPILQSSPIPNPFGSAMGRPQVSNISDFVEQTLESPLPSPEVLLLLLLLQLDLLGVVVAVVVGVVELVRSSKWV